MKTRVCAYPFLDSQDLRCDYELTSDYLASVFGLLASQTSNYQEFYLWCCDKVYHANGSVRGKLAIDENDFEYLLNFYNELETSYGPIKHFVIPSGVQEACQLHLARCECKKLVRLMYKLNETYEVAPILFDFISLLSNTCFMLALVVNKEQAYQEQVFVSKSYGS